MVEEKGTNYPSFNGTSEQEVCQISTLLYQFAFCGLASGSIRCLSEFRCQRSLTYAL